MLGKTLHNTTVDQASKNIPDLKIWGDGDMFKLLCKASSFSEGWMKSTKAMEVHSGVVLQVTTQQRNPDDSYTVAEAVCFVPDVRIKDICEHGETGAGGVVDSRKLVAIKQRTVHAIQFTEDMANLKADLPEDVYCVSSTANPELEKTEHEFIIKTPAGNLSISESDWIVMDQAGGKHVYSHESFESIKD